MFPADPLFSGRIDDFRIYNYALTVDEIAGVMEDRDELSEDLEDHAEDATGIDTPQSSTLNAQSSVWYNLNGQPAHQSQKGILLQAGKKKLNR
jgi:hypothetical protein